MADPKPIESTADLQLDPENANDGTERGLELLRESVDQCGFGRSILADKNGVVIAGNKTFQVASERGLEVEVVQSSGDELVIVQRTDLDLSKNPEARQLAYYDNRVQELDLNWSGRQMRDDLLKGVDLSSGFFPEEVDRLTYVATEVPSAAELGDVAPVEVTPVDVAPEAVVPAVKEPKPPKQPKPLVELTFENITQQIRWTALMRALRERYPDAPTQAARLSQYLTEQGIV